MQAKRAWIKRNQLGVVLMPWLVTALVIVAAKFYILHHSGFEEIALSFGGDGKLNFWEKAHLLRSDLLYYFLLLPTVLVLLTSRLPVGWRITVTILFALSVETITLIELAIYKSTGAFSSARNIAALVSWTLKSGDLRFIRLSPSAAWFLAGLFAGSVAMTAWTVFALRRGYRRINDAVLVTLLSGITAGAIASIPRVPRMPWSEPLLESAVRAAFFDRASVLRRHDRSIPELMQNYREREHVLVPSPTTYTGKAKNYNVILFLMESIPAQAFDPSRDSLADTPNSRRLRDSSFILGSHFTSYPLTNAAFFSIVTSIYVKSPTGSVLGEEVQLPGLIHSLRDEGYESGYYGFVWSNAAQRDDRMLKGLGFQSIVPPDIDEAIDRNGAMTFFGPAQYTAQHDHESLQSMCRQIHAWTQNHSKFATAFFPELGHDPYRELPDRVSHSDMERSHSLAVYQDALLGELIEELERDQVLNNTIIVFSSDHGMRTEPSPKSVPPFWKARDSHGRLQDATMRVPMMIYVPKVLRHAQRIDIPTSHIDVTPTLLDLLDISPGMDPEQGSPIYGPEVMNRRLFLPMDFMGATGYYYQGSYYSRGASGVVYKGSTLDFTNRDVLEYGSVEADGVRRVLAQHDAEQDDIVDLLLQHGKDYVGGTP